MEKQFTGYRLRSLLVLLMLAAFALFFQGCRDDSGATTLKLAHSLPTSHPVHNGMAYMAKELDRISDGRMEIEIYHSGQLGSERQCLELLQIGSLDITKVSAAVMENFAPNLKVLGLPYIFRDQAHCWDVLLGEIGKDLLLQGEKYWLRGLCFYDAGSRSFYTKSRPINSPADLNGLKLRVMNSQTAMQMVKTLGGAPTPISWGELYTALQQGVVDGAENNPPSFYTSHHYEVCKYYSIDEHTSIPDILLIGTSTWNKLTAQEKEWLQEAADISVSEQRRLWKEAQELALEEVQKAGVQINYPDKAPFREKVKNIYESYRSEPEVYDLIQRIRQSNSKI